MSYLNYQRSFTVAVSDADCKGRLKPSAILQYLQDVATDHAEILGVGFGAMFAKNMIWVQTSVQVEILKYPKIGQQITVSTFPFKPGLVECERDYYVFDAEGNEILRAASFWCVLDSETRKIQRSKSYFNFADELYRPDPAFSAPNKKVQLPSEMDVVYDSAVRYSQLDRNGHVNNARYGDFALDSFDGACLNQNDIAAFDIVFMHELRLGDRFKVTHGQGEGLRFAAADKDGVSLFAMRCKLKPRVSDEIL